MSRDGAGPVPFADPDRVADEITRVGAAVAWPLAARAEQQGGTIENVPGSCPTPRAVVGCEEGSLQFDMRPSAMGLTARKGA